jgi:sensor domain CHASE-containing protein
MNLKKLSRHWLPLVVAVAAVLASVVLRQRLARQENAAINAVAVSQVLIAKSQTEAQMTSQILVLSRLAIRWEIWGKPVENDWESEASVLDERLSGVPGD